MKRNIFFLPFLFLTICSCEFKCNVGNTPEEGKEVSSSTSTSYTDNVNTSQIMNDIEIKATGDVKVYRAFLADENGKVIRDNTTTMGKYIYLNINIENGWEEENGKSFIGASEIISTDNGTQILDSGDMFSNYDETGVDANNAKFITLKANVDNATGPIEYFVVNFRVWDKKGNGEITGSYKFKIRE